jgi:hypothetical protein
MDKSTSQKPRKTAIATGARNAALILASAVGRFGATKDNAPEAFDAKEIEGSMPIGGFRKGRQSVVNPKPRRAPLKLKQSIYAVSPEQIIESRRHADNNLNSQVVGSMRGDEWIKENRRLRSAGLPQNRI